MKDYIYNRIKESEMLMGEEIALTRLISAHKIDFGKSLKKVLSPFDIKTMPKIHRSNASYAFSCIWEREINRNIIYPALYNGKLYSKWEKYPEGMKAELKEGVNHKRIPTWVANFTEGQRSPIEL